jgi:hypothetical protein
MYAFILGTLPGKSPLKIHFRVLNALGRYDGTVWTNSLETVLILFRNTFPANTIAT